MTRPRSPFTPAPTRRVPRPPRWLPPGSWVLAGLGWLAYPSPFTFVAFGVFAAAQVWWVRWRASKDRP